VNSEIPSCAAISLFFKPLHSRELGHFCKEESQKVEHNLKKPEESGMAVKVGLVTNQLPLDPVGQRENIFLVSSG
jgi:hypothetical protein